MIRVPLATEKGARIEVRTVAPDTNPYLAYFLLLKAGFKGMEGSEKEKKKLAAVLTQPVQKLPGVIQPAIEAFKKSAFVKEMMGEESHRKYWMLKQKVAERSPAALGDRVKNGEVHYHHEVTNQLLWGDF